MMVTKQDLVEAYSFNRRRLVTAFISGTPGHEVEPGRPGRTMVGGLGLAGLVLAGAVIARILGPSFPEEWPSAPVDSDETFQATGPGR
jgi:hypothetical protein